MQDISHSCWHGFIIPQSIEYLESHIEFSKYINYKDKSIYDYLSKDLNDYEIVLFTSRLQYRDNMDKLESMMEQHNTAVKEGVFPDLPFVDNMNSCLVIYLNKADVMKEFNLELIKYVDSFNKTLLVFCGSVLAKYLNKTVKSPSISLPCISTQSFCKSENLFTLSVLIDKIKQTFL